MVKGYKKPPTPEVYVSIDIEVDGQCPGKNSMLSLGAVAFDQHGAEIDAFERNFETLPGAGPDQETDEWWQREAKDAYDYTRTLQHAPAACARRSES